MVDLSDRLAREEAKLVLRAAQDRLDYLRGEGQFAPENWLSHSVPGSNIRIPIPPSDPPPISNEAVQAAEALLETEKPDGK